MRPTRWLPTPRRGSTLALLGSLVTIGAVFLLLLSPGPDGWLQPEGQDLVGASTVPTGSVATTFLVSEPSPLQHVPSSILGVNLGADNAWNATDQELIEGTTTSYLRYPSGVCGEGLNWTSGVAYGDLCYANDVKITVPEFVADCELVHCHAILQLPTEIDSPSTAAYYVSWLETTEHFTPAYFELGNEPTQWTHFGCPWSTWTTTCASGTNATPQSYAPVVVAYVSAIRQVDASTPILGLGGVGQSIINSEKESGYAWAKAIFQATGDSIQGISVHDYPGRTGTATSAGSFYSVLTTGDTLLPNMEQAREGISAGCGNCTHEQILITESAMYTCGACNAAYRNSFADALGMGVDITEAIDYGAVNIDLESLYNGAKAGNWFGPSTPEPVYYLYSDILAKMPLTDPSADWLNATELTGPGMLWIAATYVAPGAWTLLILNLNVSEGAALTMGGSGFPTTGAFHVYRWNGSTAEPVQSSASALPSVEVGPQSMLLIVANTTTSTVPTYALGGVVSNALNGAPVAGATVSVSPGTSVTTGPNGDFEFTVANGSVNVSVSAPGYHPKSAVVSVEGSAVVLNFPLVPIPAETFELSGGVTLATDGSPIAGATVELDGASPVGTAATGHFGFSVINGTYTVSVTASGYLARSASVSVNGRSVSLNFSLDHVAAATFELRGTVTYARNSSPVDGATVRISGGSTLTTGPQGSFGAPEPNGSYEVTAWKTGFGLVGHTVAVEGTAATVALHLQPYLWRVTGVVTSTESDRAVSGANVSVRLAGNGTSVRSSSNVSGGFVLWLPNGTEQLTVAAAGFAPAQAMVHVENAEIVENLTLQPASSSMMAAPFPPGPGLGATVGLVIIVAALAVVLVRLGRSGRHPLDGEGREGRSLRSARSGVRIH